jgi:hypothetical protein
MRSNAVPVRRQMAILDGNAYDAKCLEAGQERDEDLDACGLLLNNKQAPLLVPSGAAGHSPQAKVVVQLTVRGFQAPLWEPPAMLFGSGMTHAHRCRVHTGRGAGCNAPAFSLAVCGLLAAPPPFWRVSTLSALTVCGWKTCVLGEH